jgi:hypothetical protein
LLFMRGKLTKLYDSKKPLLSMGQEYGLAIP